MLILRDPAETCSVGDVQLRRILDDRFASLSDDEPYDPDAHGQLVVCEDDDRLEQLQGLLGFSPLENRFTGAPFGQANFSPSFELIEDHQCCFEMVFVLSDDGFGVLVFVPKGANLDPRLIAICERYAISVKET